MKNTKRTFNGKTAQDAVMAIDLTKLTEAQIVEWYGRSLVKCDPTKDSDFYLENVFPSNLYGETYFIQKCGNFWMINNIGDGTIDTVETVVNFIDDDDINPMREWLINSLDEGFEIEKVMPFLGLVADK